VTLHICLSFQSARCILLLVIDIRCCKTQTMVSLCAECCHFTLSKSGLIPRILIVWLYCLHREYNEALQRLADMIRGIGDPLVAVYARCYLSRVSFIPHSLLLLSIQCHCFLNMIRIMHVVYSVSPFVGWYLGSAAYPRSSYALFWWLPVNVQSGLYQLELVVC
jgi:hypothetical protein